MARLIKDGWIKAYLKYTENNESPEAYHLWTAISVVASALRDRLYISRGYKGKKLFPYLYIILCGPTGCKKSSAADIGMDLLRQVDGIRVAQDKITAEGLIDFLGKEQLQHTTNSNGKDTMRLSNTGTLYAPELVTLLGSTAYTASLLEVLTRIYDGGHFEYRLKTRKPVVIENVTLNFLGGSTPEWLARGLTDDAFGGGFIGRNIFIMQNQPRGKVAWLELSEEERILEEFLQTDLQHIAGLHGEFNVTEEARKYYVDWYDGYNPDYASRLSGFYQRKPTHILKLAMILSIARTDDLIIDVKHIRSAIKLFDFVEKYMQDAFAYIGATNEAKIAQHVINALHIHKGAIVHQVLVSKVRHLLRSMREFGEIIEMLRQAGVLLVGNRDGVAVYMFTKNYSEFLKKRSEEVSKRSDGDEWGKDFK